MQNLPQSKIDLKAAPLKPISERACYGRNISAEKTNFCCSILPFYFICRNSMFFQLVHVNLSTSSQSRKNYIIPTGIYLLKVNNRNIRTRCEICSKLTIKTPERRHWRLSGVFIVNFKHISHLVLLFLLLT